MAMRATAKIPGATIIRLLIPIPEPEVLFIYVFPQLNELLPSST